MMVPLPGAMGFGSFSSVAKVVIEDDPVGDRKFETLLTSSSFILKGLARSRGLTDFERSSTRRARAAAQQR
jgi:hypothetical protein